MHSSDPSIPRRLWVLLGILVLGFSSIWTLPKQEEMRASRLSQDLPERVGGWYSEKREVSDVEKKTLAADTEFARRSYQTPALEGFDGIEVSVVFSGRDINNSLHRPEVCLRAQGWNFIRQRPVVLKGVLVDGGDLPVREIVSVRPRVGRNGEEPPKNKMGEPVYDMRIQYYTYFGAERIVSGHYERTMEDIKARLFGGYDQRWAYATFSVGVTSVYRDQGFDVPDHRYYDEEQSTQIMVDFLKQLLPEVVSGMSKVERN
ncbi:exosortase-associated EpsI family protein [Rubritalea tangerina]|uniref:Exosortase-associated EpsI family protein n=1 Tax=Rubritalea tangerina TaxID=430798 RepID=A0ABW4ZBF9_9BACT